jgi:hypothetical protein
MSKNGSSAGGKSGAGRRSRADKNLSKARRGGSASQHAERRRDAERVPLNAQGKNPKARKPVKRLSKSDAGAVKAAKSAKKPTKAQRELKEAASIRKTVAKNAKRAKARESR